MLNAGSLALLYALVGILWIAFSDWLLFRDGLLGVNPSWWVQSAKGLFYVSFTAFGLYLLVKRLAARIAQNAELLERVINHLPETVAVLNREGSMVYANAAAKEKWLQGDLHRFREGVEGHEVFADGRVFVHGKTSLGVDGLALVHFRDITEKERLVQEQGLYFNAAAHYMMMMDSEGTLLEVNPSARYELALQEAPLGGVLGTFLELHPEEEQQRVRTYVDKMKSERYASFEASVVGREGERCRVRWSMHYPQGARRVMVIGYDISRDYALMSELRVVQAMLEASREAMIQTVFEGSEWQIVHANASARLLLDLPLELPSFGPIAQFFVHPTPSIPHLFEVPRGVGVFGTRSWAGKVFEAEWSTTRVEAVDGKTYVSCIVRDVTERLKYEADLRNALEASEEARKFKDALFANVHHEVRTPLTVILGYAELLYQVAEEHREPIEAIVEQGRALERSLLLLLEAAHCSSKEPAPRAEPDLLGHALLHKLKRFVQAGQDRGIQVDLSALDVAPRITHNHARVVARIVEIVLENALKFTEQGRVWVTLEPIGGRCKICVHDTGPGFPESELERVFEAFAQPNAGTTRTHGGMGLGLYVARCHAHAIGGTIGAANHPEGGAVVWILV